MFIEIEKNVFKIFDSKLVQILFKWCKITLVNANSSSNGILKEANVSNHIAISVCVSICIHFSMVFCIFSTMAHNI